MNADFHQSTIDESVIQNWKNNPRLKPITEEKLFSSDFKNTMSNVFYCPSSITSDAPVEYKKRGIFEDPRLDNKSSNENHIRRVPFASKINFN
jgi:hypothetical protein